MFCGKIITGLLDIPQKLSALCERRGKNESDAWFDKRTSLQNYEDKR